MPVYFSNKIVHSYQWYFYVESGKQAVHITTLVYYWFKNDSELLFSPQWISIPSSFPIGHLMYEVNKVRGIVYIRFETKCKQRGRK